MSLNQMRFDWYQRFESQVMLVSVVQISGVMIILEFIRIVVKNLSLCAYMAQINMFSYVNFIFLLRTMGYNVVYPAYIKLTILAREFTYVGEKRI